MNKSWMRPGAVFRQCVCAWLAFFSAGWIYGDVLRIATFRVDVTPPIGTPLCDALVPAATGVNDPLSARGIVLLPADQLPIVLVAVDWVGIGNEGHDAWREALAAAADTDVGRVCVHSLHQHDAPGCDFLADRLAAEVGLAGELFNVEFARRAIERVATAVDEALAQPKQVTHLGYGQAEVEKVASNRRLLGPDGKVQQMRMTACPDPAIRALPEGVIDPYVKVLEFGGADGSAAVLSYYATHPQSYYRTGLVSADFVGMARSMRDEAHPEAIHIHFNGAGGNIGAGKYNDGSPENRPVLAARLADGMKRAWESRQRFSTSDFQLRWDTREVRIPPALGFAEDSLRHSIANEEIEQLQRLRDIRDLAWLERCKSNHEITVARLRLGPIDILHLPGELFVEYQLAAQAMRPTSFVCTAAYGDYGMGYIGLAESYLQGGYETGNASRVSPRAEQVLMQAIRELME